MGFSFSRLSISVLIKYFCGGIPSIVAGNSSGVRLNGKQAVCSCNCNKGAYGERFVFNSKFNCEHFTSVRDADLRVHQHRDWKKQKS